MTSQKLELYMFTRQTGRKKTHEKALGNYKVTRAKGFQFTSLVHKIYSILYQLALLYRIVNTHYALLYFSCQKTSTTMMNTWHCPCADTSSGSATLIEILYLFSLRLQLGTACSVLCTVYIFACSSFSIPMNNLVQLMINPFVHFRHPPLKTINAVPKYWTDGT